MSVSGTNEHQGLAMALELLTKATSTGVLRATEYSAEAQVAMRNGKVLYANCSGTPMLGQILVEMEILSQEELDAALWVQRQDNEWQPLGKVLSDVGAATAEALIEAIETQVTQVLENMLGWRGGRFEFDMDDCVHESMLRPGCRSLQRYKLRLAIANSGELN